MINKVEMKIYCKAPMPTKTMKRIQAQIEDSAPPNVGFVADLREADLRIILAIGVTDVLEAVKAKPCVILQLCYQTGGPLEVWDEIWRHSVMIGSYYHLNTNGIPYVRFPMGFDPKVFYPDRSGKPKLFRGMVTGRVEGPEEIKSVHEGLGVVLHVGENMHLGPGYINKDMIGDDEMRQGYQQSMYVMGLRRVEGFELPVIEGAACGAQPVCFDYECYRHWFEDFAIFINPDRDVARQLRDIADAGERFRTPPDLTRFHVKNAWKPFWDKLEETI